MRYKEHPENFLGHPKLPKYKDKQKGRNILVYDVQALSGGRGNKGALKQGIIKPSGLPVIAQTQQETIKQVRIVPRNGFYCSFLDIEEIKHHEHYVGKRIKRGMFRSQFGALINADVNGAYNIIRKVASDAFERGCRGCAVHPVPLIVGVRRERVA